MQSETVLLDTMTGYDFEEFFAHLLGVLGRGRVEKVLFSQDEGRDILVRTPRGLLVVECKHHPNSGIGRPVVQKLHSAVISAGASSGMLVTTGHFTKEALVYAQKISPHIEMIDRPLLAEMAARAGITIVTGNQRLEIWTFSVPDVQVTSNGLGQYLDTVLEGSPRHAGSLIRSISRTVRYQPIYLVTYDVHAVFSTGVGVIHSEHSSQAKIAIDGTKGQPIDQDIIEFIGPEAQSQFLGIPKDGSGSLRSFQLDAVTAQSRARELISQLHTRDVTYYGKNHQRYTKVCRPGEHEIFISDIRQVQLPRLHLKFKLLETDFAAAVIQGPSGRLFRQEDNILTCRVCNSLVEGEALVCDICGRTTHPKRLRISRSHGFRCHECNRTTCRFDGRWSSRWLIFKKLLCDACARESEGKGRKVHQFDPISP